MGDLSAQLTANYALKQATSPLVKFVQKALLQGKLSAMLLRLPQDAVLNQQINVQTIPLLIAAQDNTGLKAQLVQKCLSVLKPARPQG